MGELGGTLGCLWHEHFAAFQFWKWSVAIEEGEPYPAILS